MRCPACEAIHDAADLFCPKCGAASADAPTVPSGEINTAVDPQRAALLVELQQALAPQIQVIREIGSGGMGTVFLGRDPSLKRLVVIKVLLPELAHDARARARFAREAESAAAVAHPNVVSVYGIGELPQSQTAYFIMQFIEGPTLQQAWPSGHSLPESQAKRILGEVASALAAAHARGLVHRDIKPSNIMLEKDTGRAVVLDFGISAARGGLALTRGEKLTVEGTSIGTPEYMSPEQAAAEEVTEKSDIYNLGVVAFELLTGRLPFAGVSPMALAASHIKDAPPRVGILRPDIDPQLAALADRCLAKQPEARPTAADIARYLAPSIHQVIEWPPPGLESLRGRGTRLVDSLSLMAVGAIGFMLLMLRQPILLSPLRLNVWFQTHGVADPTRDFDSVPFWFFVLALFSCAVLLLFPILVTRAWILAARLRRARRSGYPWPVLLDVAWDAWTNTPTLLNGTERFALLTPLERARLMRLRRSRSVLAACAPALVVLATLTWALGWTGGWATGADILPIQEAAPLFGPAVLCLLVVAWLAQPERRLATRANASRLFGWRDEPVVRQELLSAWLASTGKPMVVKRSRALLSALASVAVLLALVLVLAGSLVFFAAFIAARNVAASKEYAIALLGSLTTDSLRSTPWREYDSLIALSARLPNAPGIEDVEAARRLVGWSYEGASIPAYLNVDTSGRPVAGLPQSNYAFRSFLFSNRQPITDAPIPKLALDTLTPVLALWRRLARSAPLSPLWIARPGLPSLESPLQLMVFWNSKDAAYHNLSAGLLALRLGDSATALLRARENIAVGRHLMRSPVFTDYLVGLMQVSLGADLVRRTGEVMSDPARTAEAERLRALVLQARADFAPWWRGGAQLLMSDPVDPALLPGLTNYGGVFRLPPAALAEVAHAAVTSFCMNTREILFGPDLRRRDLLAHVGGFLARVPRMDDLVLAQRRELDNWLTAPSRTNGRYVDMLAGIGQWQGPLTNVLAPLARIGLGGMKDRMLFCLNTSRSLGNIVQ